MNRRQYSAKQKVEILREHLENQVTISEIAERYGIHPNMLHKRKMQLFENASEYFGRSGKQQNREEGQRAG